MNKVCLFFGKRWEILALLVFLSVGVEHWQKTECAKICGWLFCTKF